MRKYKPLVNYIHIVPLTVISVGVGITHIETLNPTKRIKGREMKTQFTGTFLQKIAK